MCQIALSPVSHRPEFFFIHLLIRLRHWCAIIREAEMERS